jgi:hypothetical protein
MSQEFKKEEIEGYIVQKRVLAPKMYDAIWDVEEFWNRVSNQKEIEEIVGPDAVLGALCDWRNGIIDVIVVTDYPHGLELYRFKIEKVEYGEETVDFKIYLKIEKRK